MPWFGYISLAIIVTVVILTILMIVGALIEGIVRCYQEDKPYFYGGCILFVGVLLLLLANV